MENHIEEVVSSSKRDKGFTLVELLIVIVILGILATVTVFAVRGITDKGTKSACAADKKTLEVAVEAYFAQYGGTAIATTGDIPGSSPAIAANADPELTLKAAGYIREASPKYNVNAAGVLAVEDATCT